MDILDKQPDEILRNAAHHLMDVQSIWYDRVPNAKGNLVYGPHHQTVSFLCRLASDIRAGIK
jgi:hypothetical protein